MSRILLVDDDPEIRELIAMGLESAGFEVIMAENGQEGLQRFNDETPDLILTDIKMPEMDGIEFIKNVRNSDGTVPIIVSSGFAETQDLATEIGANGFLSKPFRSKNLIDTIEQFLRP